MYARNNDCHPGLTARDKRNRRPFTISALLWAASFTAAHLFLPRGDQESRAGGLYSWNDGIDYVPTNKHVLFGHHYASIAGAAPIIGPAVAGLVILWRHAQRAHLRWSTKLLTGTILAIFALVRLARIDHRGALGASLVVAAVLTLGVAVVHEQLLAAIIAASARSLFTTFTTGRMEPRIAVAPTHHVIATRFVQSSGEPRR